MTAGDHTDTVSTAALGILYGKEMLWPEEERRLPSEIQYKGKNQRQVLIIINAATDKADMDFLKAMVEKGLKIPLEEIAVVNHAVQKSLFRDLYYALKPQQVMCFGLQPADLGIHIEITPYQAFHFHECELLFAKGAAEHATNQNLKNMLWTAMKKMFRM